MNALEKLALDNLVKPQVTQLTATLTANRDANVAQLQADLAKGGQTAEALIATFFTAEAAKYPLLQALGPVVLPLLTGFIGGLTDAGGVTGENIPIFYDKIVAFLQREVSLI